MDKHSSFNRRQFLKIAGAVATMATIPSLVLAKVSDGFFDLRAQKTPHKLADANSPASELWLYNGTTPGPEIRVSKNETVKVRFTNELDEPTSIHWHGIRIVNAMDGVSGLTQDPVQPGDSFDYEFTVPDAGTFWYHAHNKSWEQVARGLYGSLIVDEPKPLVDHDHDITLVIDDWRLGNDGTIHLASMGSFGDWSHAGRLGNWLTVNGKSQPTIKLKQGEPYRLRLINASNARVLQIDPNAIGAKIIGYDGFVFSEPRDTVGEIISMTPAQRVDLIVTPTEAATQKLNDVGDYALQEVSGRKALSMVLFEVMQTEVKVDSPPIVLSPNSIAAPNINSALEVPLLMEGGAMGGMGQMMHQGLMMDRGDIERTKQMWAFNGVANLGKEPLFRVKVGQTILLTASNQTGWLHGMHVHGHHFQILKHNGKTPRHLDWRDTFNIDRDETVQIAFVADNPGKWLLHCHMLEHAAAGMNTWFEVT